MASCPANSQPTGSTCTCNDTYQPDPTGTSCVPAAVCPVDPLPPLPTDDACAQSLDKGRGVDVNNACPNLTPEMQKQAQCVADKIHALYPPISYTGPSATIRNTVYQKHLLDVWNKSLEIQRTPLSDAEKQACAAVIAGVNNEMEWHKIKYSPSTKGDEAPHVLGNAIDIPEDAANALIAQVTNTTFVTIPDCIFCIPYTITIIGDVQDYVNSATVYPPACNLRWGGRFKPKPDNVHYQLP